MTSKTSHQMNTGLVTSAQHLPKPLTAWLASAQGFVIHIGPLGRGFVMLLILLLFAIPALAMLFPRQVIPIRAPLDVFSAERALTHLPIIASEPHPQGSPAQARVQDYLVWQLTNMGLEVEIQRTGGLQNVVARLHGSNPTGAVVILTHYDTVSNSPGAGDNSSAVSVLLEIMRSLSDGPALHNDVIALFHDGEEYGTFAGTRAFVREHPWMKDVHVAISIDGAVAGFISANEVGPKNNGRLVQALDRAYTGGLWMSMSGGGIYNSTPFREAGIPVLALEDNYPFRQRHSAEDLPEIINAGTIQQMGEQTLAITRELGNLNLVMPKSNQETFFSLPFVGFIHYPESWSLPLAITAAIFLLLALGIALWRRFASWRGMGVAFGTILTTAFLAVLGVGALQPHLPKLLGWKTDILPDWPEVIPPHGWLVAGVLGLLILGLAVGGYLLTRRWSGRTDFSLIGLLPFSIPAVALALAEPRAAYAFIWPVLISSLVWITAIAVRKSPTKWSLDLTTTIAALPLVVMLLPSLPGIIMSDGMKSLNILAGVEVTLLAVILPAIDGLLVRQPALK